MNATFKITQDSDAESPREWGAIFLIPGLCVVGILNLIFRWW